MASTYGPADRLLASASAVETNEYAYDGVGRLTNHIVNGQTRRFAYNYRGQMTALHDKDHAHTRAGTHINIERYLRHDPVRPFAPFARFCVQHAGDEVLKCRRLGVHPPF